MGVGNNPNNTNSDQILYVGREKVNSRAIIEKLTQDIRFLHDRINKIKAMNTPNKPALKTYEEMLESREMFLQWAQENTPNYNRSDLHKIG